MTASRGRPPRDLFDLVQMTEKARTPAERKAATRAWADYERRKAKQRADRLAAEIAAGMHPTAAEWFAKHPEAALMLRDQHGLREVDLDTAILTFDESQPRTWLRHRMVLGGGALLISEERNARDNYHRANMGEDDEEYGEPETDMERDASIAEHILNTAADVVEARCSEYFRSLREPAPAPQSAPQAEPQAEPQRRPRRTKADLKRAKNAARMREGRAAGRVKDRRPRNPRTCARWLAQAEKQLATMRARPVRSPDDAVKLWKAENAVNVWKLRVRDYGADYVWQKKADYKAKNDLPWLPLDEWLELKKKAGTFIDWTPLKGIKLKPKKDPEPG